MARYAVSDIHGCSKTLSALIRNKLSLKKSDELYLLGDYINKGPDSKGVLDFILNLQKDGYFVQCLRGNHDEMLLDINLGNTSGSWTSDLQKKNTLRSFEVESPQQIPTLYVNLISSMSLYFELEHLFLVHAGFYFGIGDPFLDKISMMNIKKFDYNSREMHGKKIVHGHLPQQLSDIQHMASQRSDVVKIDGGCVYYSSEGLGNLVALDLDTFEVFVQSNVDRPYEVNLKGS